MSELIDPKRVILRDALSYCAILLDDNNRKPICRLFFTKKKLSIALVDEAKNFVKKDIETLDEIYSFKESLLSTIKSYL
ncbi:hypothetical protein [Mucilaginibacter sp. JRF]|uniref:hypothetical protein n=1 Tax=Mucilaginibacter sp. JRF TaxID=2780088 RepID=UPI001D167EFA|nr:hypothetical protein [Mucilaginibacter sp. JRF]